MRQETDRRTWFALANEMRLLRRVRHPNIVLFFGVVLLPGASFGLILEWVEGMNLKEYTKKCNGCLFLDTEEDIMPEDMRGQGPNHKCKLLLDVTAGMQFLHAQKPPIIHRDLKPANVLVETVATPPRAKITDFGVSMLLQGDDAKGKAGTAAYMAPEVVLGKPFNASADVYSFGCTCCSTVLGRIPEKKTIKQEMAEGLARAEAPPETVAALEDCLEEEAIKRPSFAVVRHALEMWRSLNGEQPANNSGQSKQKSTLSSTRSTSKKSTTMSL